MLGARAGRICSFFPLRRGRWTWATSARCWRPSGPRGSTRRSTGRSRPTPGRHVSECLFLLPSKQCYNGLCILLHGWCSTCTPAGWCSTRRSTGRRNPATGSHVSSITAPVLHGYIHHVCLMQHSQQNRQAQADVVRGHLSTVNIGQSQCSYAGLGVLAEGHMHCVHAQGLAFACNTLKQVLKHPAGLAA